MKKTIKKRAFVSAIAMLIVSAIVLTSSTFAWFSMSKQASVEQMNLTVSSPEGIQISANAKGWTASLTQDNIFNTDPETANQMLDAYEGNHNYLPTALTPVSCGMNKNNGTTGFVNFYKVGLDDSNQAVNCSIVDQVNSADTGFVAFDIFLKVASTTTVYFARTSTFTDGNDMSQGPITALRVGFQILGNVGSDATAAQAIALNTYNANNCTIYEPDTNNRSADAVAQGQTAGEIKTNFISGMVPTNVGVRTNANKVFDIRTDGSVIAQDTIRGVKFLKSTQSTTASFTLNEGITKMRVYIWMEGQDVDCRNSVASQALTANLKFDID